MLQMRDTSRLPSKSKSVVPAMIYVFLHPASVKGSNAISELRSVTRPSSDRRKVKVQEGELQ